MTTANIEVLNFGLLFDIPKWEGDQGIILLDNSESEPPETESIPTHENRDDYIEFNYVGDETLHTSKSVDLRDKRLREKVLSVVLPARWEKEGVAPPSIGAKKKAASFISQLYNDFFLIPERIESTVEGGVFASYYEVRSGNLLSIEFYNDLDVAAIVTKGKAILDSIDIYDDKDLIRAILVFQTK